MLEALAAPRFRELAQQLTRLEARRPWVIPLSCILIWTGLLLPHHRFVPLFDGWTYADQCILEALRRPLTFGQLNCFGQPSAAYVALMSTLQRIDPGNVLLLHLGSWLLAAIAIGAFYQIVRWGAEESSSAVERLLLCLLFSSWPLFQATALNPSPDFAVLCFYLVFVAALLQGRWSVGLLAATALVLSKEQGISLYCASMLYFVWYFRPLKASSGTAIRYLGKSLVWCIPVVAYLSTLGTSPSDAPTPLGAVNAPLRRLTSIELLEPRLHVQLAGIYLISFAWLLLIPLVTYVAVAIWRALWNERSALPPSRRFLLGLLLLVTFVVTRYPLIPSLRIVAVAYPLFLVGAHSALVGLRISSRVRSFVLATMVVLGLWSTYRTVDPVSRYLLFRTRSFGTHALLDLRALSDPKEAIARDHLQYNLEFTELDQAMNRLFAAIDPAASRYVVPPGAGDGLITRYDEATRCRTLREGNGVRQPRWYERKELVRSDSSWHDAYYLQLPFDGKVPTPSDLGDRYDVSSAKHFGSSGYTLASYELMPRADVRAK